MQKKFVLETTQNWARWCPCHNGAPPFSDSNGYVCQNCGKTVCVNCIYKTEKGFLCTKCIKKNNIKKITPLESQGKIFKKHTWFLKIVIIFFLFSIILTIISILFEENIFEIAQIFVIGFILFITIILVKFFSRKKEDKEQIKVSLKEIKKLDEKIKKVD